jgi:hypothetical protein
MVNSIQLQYTKLYVSSSYSILCRSPAFDEWSHHTLHPDWIDLLFLPLSSLPPLSPPPHPSPDVGLPLISRQADNAIVEAAGSRALVFATC